MRSDSDECQSKVIRGRIRYVDRSEPVTQSHRDAPLAPLRQGMLPLNEPFHGGTSSAGKLAGSSIAAKRLAHLGSLTPEDFAQISRLKGRSTEAGAFLHEGANGVGSAALIARGWCARVATNRDGSHQIIGFLLPGDGFGLGATPWAGDRLAVMSLAPCVVVDAAAIRDLIRFRSPAHSRLIEACCQMSWLEQTYALNHIVRLGGRTAYQRVAHFVAELYIRLRDVGLVTSGAFSIPIPQQIVADALGLSGVHLNRVARALRRDGLVDFPRGVVQVRDLDRLIEIGRFENAVRVASI